MNKVLYFDLLICLLGILCGWLMFRRLPTLFVSKKEYCHIPISVIIPARNEEKNVGLLLNDLLKQNVKVEQIICVNDGSTDETAKVVESFDVTLISISKKPSHWIGKSYACQAGANHARGELLLFLDADVRLRPNALQKLYGTYLKTGTVISVQPFHTVKKWHEQLSLFFNLISIGALGINRDNWARKTSGLFGPLILIPKKTYELVGGHACVKTNVLEDMTLGEQLDKAQIMYNCFIGDEDISFRMYAEGIKPLAEGFIKNFAAGAMKTATFSLLLVTIWVSALFSVPIGVISALKNENQIELIQYTILYIIYVKQLFSISNKLGSFKRLTILFYPIYLLFFMLIFMISIYKKLFKRPVKWKGRQIIEKE